MSTAFLSIMIGIGGMFGWGIYDFLGGVYSKQIGPFKSFFWSQLAGLTSVLLLLLAFTINFSVPILVIILLPIAAVVYSAGYLFFFKGFEIGNVSIVAATMNLWAVFTMLFAFIFMGQRLSAMQSLGVFMIISARTLRIDQRCYKQELNMAGGWTRDGGVQDQIDASIEDAVKLARSRLTDGEGLSHCERCETVIPEARRKAIPGVRLCVNCQSELEKLQTSPTGFNRRGSKDSQLR